MKKILIIFILVLVIALAIILVLANTNKGISGIISNIDSTNRIITIIDNGQETKLNISNTTKLLDSRNQPTIFSEFNVRFEVEAVFKKTGETLKVEKVKITKAPNIILLSPKDNDTVGKEFVVKGLARVFENVLQIEVKNKTNNTIVDKQTIMASPLDIGLFGPFEAVVKINENVNDIEVNAFQYSAKDGSVVDKTSINLKVN
jgi:uncharacterized protein YxeA